MTSIRKDQYGWWFQIDGPPHPDGRRRRVRRSGFRTKSEAADALARLREADRAPLLGRATVEQAARLFLNTEMAGLRPNTVAQYEWAVNRIIEQVGSRQLTSVTAAEVDGWLTGTGLSARSQNVIVKTMRRIYTTAITHGWAETNVPSKVRLRTVDPTVKVWTPAQVQAWVAEGERVLPCVGLATFAADTALRRGELLAIRWDDYDPGTGTIRVVGSYTRQHKVGGERHTTGPLKRGRRQPTVTLHPNTVTLLERRRHQQDTERTLMGDGWQEHGLMWTWGDGSPIDPDWWTYTTKRIARRLDLPIHGPHVLRHSFAAAALQAGVPLEVVSLRMGHANTGITANLYGHLTPALDRQVSQLVGDLLLPCTTVAPSAATPGATRGPGGDAE